MPSDRSSASWRRARGAIPALLAAALIWLTACSGEPPAPATAAPPSVAPTVVVPTTLPLPAEPAREAPTEPPTVVLQMTTPAPSPTAPVPTVPDPTTAPAATATLAPPTATPTLPARPSAAATTPAVAPALASAAESAYRYLHQELDRYAWGSTPRLLDSYVKTASFDDEDRAWTYDNSLVLLAFLARGSDEDMAAARVLADSLLYAQAHDPEFKDGRLRDAYSASGFMGSGGAVSVKAGGSATGNMAWATLALVRASERLNNPNYLAAAKQLGQWIFDKTHDTRGAGGYAGGLDEAGEAFPWLATEHNADVYAAMMNLYRATGDKAWRDRAMAAKHFLTTMWDPDGGFFYTGTLADGVSVNTSPRPEDAQSWTWLVLGEPDKYRRALDWAASELFYLSCPACKGASGYRFSDAGDACWPEGSAHMALAWQQAGDAARARKLLEGLRHIQVAVGGKGGAAVPSACGLSAITGFDWDYPADVPHIGATAWYLFAERGYNPFWGTSVREPVPFQGVYDPVKQ